MRMDFGRRTLEKIIAEQTAIANPEPQNFFNKIFSKFRGKKKSTLEKAFDVMRKKGFDVNECADFLRIIWKNADKLNDENLKILFSKYSDVLARFPYTRIIETLDMFNSNTNDILSRGLDESNFNNLYEVVRDIIKNYVQVFEEDNGSLVDTSSDIRFIIKIASARYDIIKNNEDSKGEIINLCQRFSEDFKNIYHKVADYQIVELSDPKIFKLCAGYKDRYTPDDIITFYDMLWDSYFIKNTKKDSIIEGWGNLNIDSITHDFSRILSTMDWSEDEYKHLINQCENNPKGMALIFMAVRSNRKSVHNMDCVQEFIEKHKSEYTEYIMNGCFSKLKYLMNIHHNNVKSFSDTDVQTFMMIVSELISRQEDKDIKYSDIISRGGGSTSEVFFVGDYVVKTGYRRFKTNIPNHRRILQPIIRQKVDDLFIEVCDKVEPYGSQEKVNQIFNEMIEDGILWLDPNTANIGRLKRKNIPRHNIERKVDGEYVPDTSSSSEVATNISGEISGEPLDEGDYVIIDTDLIFDLNNKEDFMRLINGNYGMQKYMTSEMRKTIYELINKYRAIYDEENQENDEYNQSNEEKN